MTEPFDAFIARRKEDRILSQTNNGSIRNWADVTKPDWYVKANLMRVGCIDLALHKYLVYDDEEALNAVFDEEHRRFVLDDTYTL